MEKIKIVPAILTDTVEKLKTLVHETEKFTDYAQIDIMDGKLVPSRSVTVEDIAKVKIKFKWEAHLMVKQPETYLESFCKAGAKKIFFHYEGTAKPEEVISKARSLHLGVGLAVNPETTVSAFLEMGDKVDSILFLAVNPGFWGAKFIPEVLDKIAEFRRPRPRAQIGIDGGMKENTVALAARSGVNTIYVGSAIFLQPDPGESFRRLTLLANAEQT